MNPFGDPRKMMKQLQQAQERLQAEVAAIVVEASSGGGAVKVEMDGQKVLKSLTIDPEVVKSGDVEMLQDLVLTAVNEATRKVEAAVQEKVGRSPAAAAGCEWTTGLERLIDDCGAGVGPKSAQRIAFYLLRGTKDDAGRLAEAIATLLDGIRTCSECHSVTDRELCQHCSDPARSPRTICVVEEPHDVLAIEKTRDFKGRYHVLHGVLSPFGGGARRASRGWARRTCPHRRRRGGDPRHEPDRRGGGDYRLPRSAREAPGGPRHPHRDGSPRRQRPRMGRRGHHGQGPRGASRLLVSHWITGRPSGGSRPRPLPCS